MGPFHMKTSIDKVAGGEEGEGLASMIRAVEVIKFPRRVSARGLRTTSLRSVRSS